MRGRIGNKSAENATERRSYVLRRMRELGYLDEAAWQAAMDKPVARGQHGPRVQVEAPYIGEMVRLVLFEKFGERIYSEGFQVVTTVDSRLQRAADVALRSAVLEYDRRHGWRGPWSRWTRQSRRRWDRADLAMGWARRDR